MTPSALPPSSGWRHWFWKWLSNDPEGFTVRKEVTRKGKKVIKWVDMLKAVAYLRPSPGLGIKAGIHEGRVEMFVVEHFERPAQN